MEQNHEALCRMLGGTTACSSDFNKKIDQMLFRRPDLEPLTTFPLERPPNGLPLRIPSLSPAIDMLDEIYNTTKHTVYGPQSMGGISNAYDAAEDETVTKAALDDLTRHVADRTPYVQLASKRLQAAVAIRNEEIFDRPASPKLPGSRGFQSMHTTAKSGAFDGGQGAKISARNGGRRDSGLGLGSSPQTLGMHAAVDKETGEGLREFLLQKGKQNGFKKRECRGISFHDFTPDSLTHKFKNVLLAHYGADGTGERVDVYEVDLPTISVDADTGIEKQTNDAWLWILISRPLVSFDPDDTSTYVAPTSSKLGNPVTDSSSKFINQTPPSRSFKSDAATFLMPPPNFPSPLPTSWVVFAAPVAHLTVLPEQTETLPFPAPPTDPLSKGKSKTVQKRRDYDFSHAGSPLFEFSSAAIFTASSPPINFLSIDGIGPWFPADPYHELSPGAYSLASQIFNGNCEFRRLQSKSPAEHDKDGLNRCGEYDSDDNAVGINSGVGVASPNAGVWWKEFYRRMYGDRAMWRRVRRAMGRGKCRVVLRWDEYEAGEVGDGERGELAARGGKPKRVTRAESRRQSGLGFGGGEGIGQVGLGDSMRARALGNKEVRPLAKGKEKKRGVE